MVGYPPDIKPDEPTLPPQPLLLTSGGDHWKPVQTCSLEDLPPPPPPHPHQFLVVTTKTGTIGKRAVCILLECCLVEVILYLIRYVYSSKSQST